MRNFLKHLVLFAFLVSGFNAFSQSTQITYKKRGNIGYQASITFTDSLGNTSLKPENFFKSANLYFKIAPAATEKKHYFKTTDIADYFAKIRIEQKDNEIQQSNTPKQLVNSAGKIAGIILSFPKKDILIYEPFVFANPVDTTEAMTLQEVYYPSYERYKALFSKAQKLLNDKAYVESFNISCQIEKDAQNNPEITAFSFYNKATAGLPKQAIARYSDSLYKVFLKKHQVYLKKRNKLSLDSCHAVLNSFNESFSVFQPFLQTQGEGIPQLKTKIYALRRKMMSQYGKDELKLKQSVLALLETGSYSNYKFYLFVDILNRMICHIDTLRIIDGIPPLNTNTLNKFPEKSKELVSTGWFNEFNNLVELLNDNIATEHYVFDPDIISHLKLIDTLERQPYYEIFDAFNSLDTNFRNFYTGISQAAVKCSDSTLLVNLDTWMVSYKLSYAQIDNKYVAGINKGIKQVNDKQWEEAKNTFNVLERQLNSIAVPWFYSAIINFHNNESFTAKAQFSRALKLFPHYIAPRLFIFKILMAQKKYQELLNEADTAISAYDIWYFHYIKAYALFKMNRNQDCTNELLTQCIPMNRWDLKEYYLLGDAYLQLKEFGKAKAAYLKTRDIDPYANSEYFNKKMQFLSAIQQHQPQ